MKLASPISKLRLWLGRAISRSWFGTIRARLYIAFGFTASMTVVGSLIALYIFTTIGDTTTESAGRAITKTQRPGVADSSIAGSIAALNCEARDTRRGIGRNDEG